MAVNITSIKTASNGAWQGDNPLHFAFPLLIIQTILVLAISRSLAFLLKPLRQPKVIAEIIGGILLGPSALGRNKTYLHKIFPSWSSPILETVASIGLLFFLFLVGLELDLNSLRRSGKKAAGIAAAGISLPFICGIGVAFVLRKAVDGADEVNYGPFFVFMGVALSITAFPVLARILAELKLLTVSIGETAMAAAAFNDIAAWVLLALAVAISGDTKGGVHKSPLISLWVLLSGVAFVVFMLVAIRPVMGWVARRSSAHDSEACIAITLAGVLASGFVTDFIGIHSIFGAFVFGLAIPKEGEFAGRLIEKIEDFVSSLLLPLYFASSGLKTDVAKIHGAQAWGLLVLVIGSACFGKISGTFVVALLSKIPAREALTLGVLMNTKGLVELIVLNIGKEKKVLNDETFAILVLMALFTTFITTPVVMALYKPARAISAYKQRRLQSESPNKDKKQLRILACLHGPANIPSIINLIETIRGTNKSLLKLYIMHLVELTERSSSIAMVFRERKNGLPFRNPLRKQTNDKVSIAFDAYRQLGRVSVRPITGVSALASMHEDVCSVAEDKHVHMVILPFHKHAKNGGERGDVAMENVGPGWREVNQRVLKEAPCSVGVLVDRGLGGAQQTKPGDVAHGVCVLFFGGPDDREALELAGRMAEHPGVRVDVVRFLEVKNAVGNGVMLKPSPEKRTANSYSFSTAVVDREREKELDEIAIAEFRRGREGQVGYEERRGSNIVESVLEIGKKQQYELIVVGQGRFPSAMVAELAERVAEHAELGPIGDILSSSGHGVASSVLIVQQHDGVHANVTPVSKIVGSDAAANLV
ncbi:cation/H(+) antiporter 20 [Magnolia sinica]|uniref:cation/H(+) antiporter 20 n=1 Tax=Magnolia sinica TaxID=86752 RepID=UPI00265A12CC|nr:cation/H(+) antiporter 20 [Magnolia sinica]